MTKKFIVLTVLLVFVGCKETLDFKDYLNYVNRYINFTQNYVPPTNNSYMFMNIDEHATVKDYGSYDFVIVGAGSAGTILARRLTENENFKVLLLEAGGMYDEFTEIPAMSAYTPNSPFDWGYKTVPQTKGCQGMLEKQCKYPRGRGLGGSHIINEMGYIRGNRQDYDNWSNMGNKGWSYDEIVKYFKKTEHDDTNDPKHTSEYHGFQGILPVNYTFPLSMSYREIVDGCLQCGLHETDINGPSQIGVQKLPLTIKNNKRQMGGNAFIKPILGRPNLSIELAAFVTELVVSNRTVTGVKFAKNNAMYIALASKEVLVCAGAINSPQILMLSGIGPKNELEKHNIPVRHELPVGQYLTDHPGFFGLYVRTDLTYPNLSLSDYLRRYLKYETPLTSPIGVQHIIFVNTRSPGQNPPNVEMISCNPPMSIPSQQFFNLDDDTFEPLRNYNSQTDLMIFIVLLKPKSRGFIKLKSSSPVDFPLIDPGYLTDIEDDDIQILYEGVQFALNLTNTPAMRTINAKVISNFTRCEHLKTVSLKKYWYCAIQQFTVPLYHPCCSTRMGVSPKDSVVDSEFRVHQVKKLRVCDAGAMPEITSGHLMAPVMMMAEKLADILKYQY